MYIQRKIHQELKSEGETVTFLTFEDRDVLSAINSHPEEIFSFSPRPTKALNNPDPKSRPLFLFIDEVRYAADPSNFLKYLYDIYRDHLKIVATGSSAFYIDRKFTDSLAGRKRIFELQTLSFEECLIFKKFSDLSGELELIREREDYISSSAREIMEMFNEYLTFGGYPEVVLENNREEKINLLKEIKNSFLKKDVDESGISNPDKFYNLLILLAGQTGNLVNRNELFPKFENRFVWRHNVMLLTIF
jgi:hypothetical protein